MANKLLALAFMGAIYLIVIGSYDMFIGVTTFSKPEIVEISDLRKKPPLIGTSE